MEITDTRSVHFTNSHWCGDSLSTNPTPDKYTTLIYLTISQRKKTWSRKGNCSNVAKRGDSGGLSNKRGVYQSNISGSEERRGEQTSDQPQEVEFPHSVSTLQNGGIAPPQTYNSGKGFHDQDRSQRCLLLCTHEPAASAFPEVHLGGHTVSVHLPPFWSSSYPSLLHKAVETSGGPVTQTWPEDDCLSRRYHCVQSDSGGNIAGQGLNPLVTSEFGFCNQLEEISVRSFTLHGVPRLCDKFNGNELIIAKGKNESTHPVLQRPDSGKNCLRQNPSQNIWETDFVNAGCSPCTLALPTLANVASERSASRKELRDNGITQPELSE